MSVRIFAALVLLHWSFASQAEAPQRVTLSPFSVNWNIDFSHFDYVNPAAPKGGRTCAWRPSAPTPITNRFATRACPCARTDELLRYLSATSDDEPGSF